MMILPLTILSISFIALRFYFMIKRYLIHKGEQTQRIHIGILHPYSTGGGGGERVLWFIIKALQEMDDRIYITVYTNDPQPWEQLKQLIKRTFNIELNKEIKQVKLNRVNWLNPTRFLTLFMHSIGSMVVAWEALRSYTPDVFMDTIGCAPSFLIAKWFAGCHVACYVHYPTISTDMLQRVSDRVVAYNNDSRIAKSAARSYMKLLYYKLFALFYGFVGMNADVVMVNSSWTQGHIENIWWRQSTNTKVVYPPVAVSYFSEKIELAPSKRKPWMLAIGQFRPEKDHALMLRSFRQFLDIIKERSPGWRWRDQVRLVLLGGCRDAEDQKRVEELKVLASELNISDKIDFIVNAPFSTLTNMLSECTIGLHTMWNEHFGICVVEYMAAGLIPLAHNSGGPKMDIVIPYGSEASSQAKTTGYLATTESEYAEKMWHILNNFFSESDTTNMHTIQKNARESTNRFSEEKFISQVQECFSRIPIIEHVAKVKKNK